MMINATTVVLEPIFCNRLFRPVKDRIGKYGRLVALPHLSVLTGQTLEEHVDTLVPVLVPSRGEHVDRVLEVKVVVSVKVTSDELVDLGLGKGVQVLELVHRLELDDVETVGENSVCARPGRSMRISNASPCARIDHQDIPGFRFNKCSLSKAVT
jgi:hypothetical protein